MTPFHQSIRYLPQVSLGGRYSDPHGNAGSIAFYVYRQSNNELAWVGWSPQVSSGSMAYATTSTLADDWYYVRAVAYDGQDISSWSSDNYFYVDTLRPTVNWLSPTAGAVVGSPVPVSASYHEPHGLPGKVLFSVNRPDGSSVTSEWSQPVSPGQTATAALNITQPGQYDFYAIGNDGNGDPNAYGHAWNGPHRITVAQRPSAPTGVSGTAMAEMAKITWTSPTSDGGSPISKIRVSALDQSGGPNPQPIECAGSCLTSNTAHFENLSPERTYKFVVQAMNVIGGLLGAGTASSSSGNVTPQSADGLKPTNVTAVATDQGATVSWTAPILGDLLPIAASYTINTYRASDNALVGTPHVDPNSPAQITGLPNGTPVYFKVIATTAFIVKSPESEPSNTINPLGAPFPPAKPNATIDGEQATVTWSPPEARGEIPGDNGRPITGYTVNMYRESTQAIVSSQVVEASARQLTISQLMTGTPYYFTVQASNEVGTSDHSPRSESGSFSGKPFEPINVSATGGFRSANVQWDSPPPLADGTPGDNGSPITGYAVEPTPSCPECTGLTTPTTATLIEGLAAGTSYTFRVRSINARGTSNPSVAGQATTDAEPPSSPNEVQAIVGDRKVALEWKAPTRLNGSTVTGYEVTVSPECPDCSGLSGTDTTAPIQTEVGGLTNDVEYTFTVAAITPEGSGEMSAPVKSTPHRPTYAALGDSFSAGQGAPPYDWDSNEQCKRSSQAYGPQFVGPVSGFEEVQFLACAGATISEISHQVDNIEGHPDLITLTAGGNDALFGEIIETCILLIIDPCEGRFPNEEELIDQQLQPLVDLYTKAKDKADAAGADVVVFEYPQLFTNVFENLCEGDLGLKWEDRNWIRGLVSQFNDVIIQAAEEAGVNVIHLAGRTPDGDDTLDPEPFDGHEICSGFEYVNGFSFSEKKYFHSNPTGYDVMTSLLQEAWTVLRQN